MTRPFENITETFFNNLERVRENQLINFNNSEKFMVWIVGFAIGGVSIIFTNLTSINTTYSYCTIKIVLCSLCISIVSGLVYRWAFFKFQQYYQSIEFYLQGAFSNTEEMMETDPQDVSDINDIHEIIRKLKVDYDLDYNYLLETYNNYDDTNKKNILDNLKKNYKTTGNSVKQEYEFSMNYIQEVYAEAFGISKEKIQTLFDKNNAKYFKLYGKISTIAFVISCLSFLFVLGLLAILY